MYTLHTLSLAAHGLLFSSLVVSVNSGPSSRVRIEAKPLECQLVSCWQLFRDSFLQRHVARMLVVRHLALVALQEVMVEVILPVACLL